jgi:hypothetical protein
MGIPFASKPDLAEKIVREFEPLPGTRTCGRGYVFSWGVLAYGVERSQVIMTGERDGGSNAGPLVAVWSEKALRVGLTTIGPWTVVQ